MIVFKVLLFVERVILFSIMVVAFMPAFLEVRVVRLRVCIITSFVSSPIVRPPAVFVRPARLIVLEPLPVFMMPAAIKRPAVLTNLVPGRPVVVEFTSVISNPVVSNSVFSFAHVVTLVKVVVSL